MIRALLQKLPVLVIAGLALGGLALGAVRSARLGHEPFMNLQHALLGTDQICFNRSAAIIRNPGSAPVGWHTEWCGQTDGPPKNTGEVLNRGLWPSGKWFYITGSRPSHGGLCVIENSHVEEDASWLVDVFGPRNSKSSGYVAAAEWAKNRLTEYGLTNAHHEPCDFAVGWENK